MGGRLLWPHGSAGVTVEGLHFQVVGLPAPPGKIMVIAKYGFCGGPWRRPAGSLCRLNQAYGPQGVEDAARRGSVKLQWDESYSAHIPYITAADAIEIVDPWSAAAAVTTRGGLEPLNTAVASLARLLAPGCGGCVGVTGSLALGVATPSISDVDLVVDESIAEEVYARWRGAVKPLRAPASQGGFRVADTLEWRRGLLGGVHVSWIAVPRRPALHCPPLRRYPNLDQPRREWRGILRVPPRQVEALLYPPCVVTEEGYWVVSYEYNAARLLYEGGNLRVEGLRGNNTIYLAGRPTPGYIERA